MMLAMMAVGMNQAHMKCERFAAQAGRPVSFQVERMPVGQIASNPLPIAKAHSWSTQQFQVGLLAYKGSGFRYKSRDSRFSDIRDAIIDQRRTVCRFGFELPSGYDSATGKDVQTGQITLTLLLSATEAPKGSSIAGEVGAQPVLAGYVMVASYPVYRASKQMLIALMKPEGRGLPATTLIVASRLAKGPMPTAVFAKLRGTYQAISASRNLHGTDIGVSAAGVGRSGSLKDVSFRLAGEALDALMTQLGASTQ